MNSVLFFELWFSFVRHSDSTTKASCTVRSRRTTRLDLYTLPTVSPKNLSYNMEFYYKLKT